MERLVVRPLSVAPKGANELDRKWVLTVIQLHQGLRKSMHSYKWIRTW